MTKDAFNLNEFLPYRLNRAAEAVSLDFARLYKDRYSLTRSEWRVLAHLGHWGTLTATDIGRRAGLHKTKVSRAVRALEGRRWLTRRLDGQDRRIEHLTLTAAGQRAYDDLGALAVAHDKQLRERLDTQELAALTSILAKLKQR